MKRKLFLIALIQVVFIITANAQVNPINQVIAYFKTGVTRVPPSDSTANITSTNVLNVLHTYNIPNTGVIPSFPSFNETDTVNAEIGETSRQLDRARVFTITLSMTDSANKANFINALNNLTEVLFAYQNTLTIGDVVPNDTDFSYQWGLNNPDFPGRDIHAESAWDIYKGNSNAIIAIIDYGVDRTHNDLSAKITGGDQGFSILSAPGQQLSHGTAVAGIAAASTNNTTGIAGVDWYAKIYPKHVISVPGETPVKSDADVAQGIIDAVNYSPYVWTLNNSYENDLGLDQYGSGIPGAYSVLIRSAYAWAYRNNRVSVSSMGNFQVLTNGGDPFRYSNHTSYPAGFNTGIISVGSTKTTDEIMQASAQASYIDVVAPGNSIYTTNFNNTYISFLGTSAAVPFVSGIASLVKGYNPNLSNDDIEEIINLSADHLPTPQSSFSNAYGNGRVNAQRALQSLQSPNTLQHLSTTGGTVYSTSANETRIFLGAPGLADAAYIVKRSEIRKAITLPAMCNTIGVWGRGVGTTGYREENGRCFGEGICEVVPGTLTATGCTLRTYIYEVWTALGQYVGFYPGNANNAVFQYTVLGAPAPTSIAGDGSFCATTSNSYTIPNLPSGATVQWQATPSGIVTINSPYATQTTLTKTGNGVVTLTATITNACGVTTLNKTISVGIPPVTITGPSSICACQCCNYYTATNIPGATYTWSISPTAGNSVSTDMGNQAEVIITSPCYLTVQATTSCGTSTSTFHIFMKPAGQCHGGCSAPSFVIAPNPAQNTITISLANSQNKNEQINKPAGYSISGIKLVSIYNVSGKLVRQQKISANNISQVQIDVSSLTSGIYPITISDGKLSETQNVIIQR